MDELLAVARAHGLWVIEDAAQAHAAEYRGRLCGGLGDIACFSFFPSKNLGAYGDGGMITSNDPALMERVRRLRDHGRVGKYEHTETGWGYRLDAIQAAILNAKLPHLEDWTRRRRAAAFRYDQLLADLDIVTPIERPYNRHVYYLYVVRTPDRDGLRAHLSEQGIGVGIHYPIPMHLQPAFAGMGLGRGAFPVAEAAADQVLSIPMYPEITLDQQTQVAEAIAAYVN
jgi:dTDP-4-amino-4,6-dideoxygalactose transaminase